MAIDELAAIHERIVDPIRSIFHTSGFFFYAWVIPGGILVLVLGILFLGWLLRLPPKIRLGLGLSALLYVTGVLLLEAVGGWWASNIGGEDLVHSLIATTEESLEMLGLIAFTYFAAKFLLAETDGNRVEVRLIDV